MTRAATFRQLLRDARPLVSPGVYDGYSARLAEQMGYKTAATTGAGLANSVLGQPDIGILSLMENVDACRHIARSVAIPMMADADTGYGNAVTVYHTVQYFEEAGIVGINIEDQVWPKRCGAMNGKAVIDSREMCMKIEAAIKAKKDKDFVINARTDAIAVEGIEGAVRRAKEYAAAGADMIYPDAVRGEDDIQRILDAVPDTPVNINMGFGIRSRPTTPLVSIKRLGEMGVARVSCPRMLTAAAISGMKKALVEMRRCIETGEVADRPDLLASMEEIAELAGYERIDALEKAFTLKEDLERRYGEASVTYVVKAGEGEALKPTRTGPFKYIPINRRPRLQWPNGARVALWINPNVEFFGLDDVMPGNLNERVAREHAKVPNVRNWSLRDYGNRVGVWRLMEVLTRYGMRGSAALNSDVCLHHPEVIEEMMRLGWELLGHNQTNAMRLTEMAPEQERESIMITLDTIQRVSGKRPVGWLGAGLAETWNTLEYLSEGGVRYVCDWVNDEQPYTMEVGKPPMVSLPYSLQCNDVPAYFDFKNSVPEFEATLKRQFDVLYRDSAESGRVMAIAVHPFVSGQPHRVVALEKALEYICGHAGVWRATGWEIVQHYLASDFAKQV